MSISRRSPLASTVGEIPWLPDRADTDGDGLNDSEELNLGSDGFQTDPWKFDTDGDGLRDDFESLGWRRLLDGSVIKDPDFGIRTDPTRPDTDRDGIVDVNDRMPLGDAFVTVHVSYAVPRGTDDDGNTTLEPFVSIQVGNQTAWTRWLAVAPGATASFNHDFSLNVDDSLDSISVTVQAWDYDADDMHDQFSIDTGWNNGVPFAKYAVTFTHSLISSDPTTSTTYGYGSLKLDPISFTVATIVPSRIGSRLIVPADYSGVYNATSPYGYPYGRRYVGEPRFVGFALNVTSTAVWQCVLAGVCDDATVAQRVLLVPRSAFYDSQLYAKLSSQDLAGLPSGLAFRENDTAASRNTDALHQLITGNVTGPEYLALLGFLGRNASGGAAYRMLNLPNDLFLYSLPDDAVRLIAYRALASTPSVQYRFCSTPNCQAPQVEKPWWEQLWEGLTATVTGWITSAVVFAVNVFVKLVEVLAQVGSWVWTNIVGPGIAVVANAVQAAGEALGQFVDWIIESALSLFRAGLPALDIRLLLDGVSLPVIPPNGTGLDPTLVSGLVDLIFSGWFFYLMVGVGLLVQLVSTYLALQSFGTALVASHLIAPKIVEILVQTWLKTVITIAVSLAITASIAAMLYLVLPSSDPFWREGLGLSFVSVALAVEKAPQIVRGFRADPTGVAKELTGFALAIIGLIIAFAGTGVSGAFWGFIFAAAGAALTLLNKDVFDWSPVSPLKNVEEIMSVVSLSYATANLAREIS